MLLPAALLLVIAAGPALASGLETDRAVLKIAPATVTRRDRDRVRIRGRFDVERFEWGFRFAPAAHDVRISLDGLDVLDTGGEEGARWKLRSGYRWKLRLAGSPGVKLTLDFVQGRFLLSAKRCALGGLDPAGRDGASIFLEIAGQTFSQAVRFEPRGRRFVYREADDDGSSPPGDPDPPDPGDLVPAPYRMLVDTSREADESEPIWANEMVLRSEPEWIHVHLEFLDYWIEYPEVGDGEMVLTFCVPGDVFTGFEVYRQGAGLLVRYKTGLLPCHPDARKDMEVLRVIAVPKVEGAVAFERL